MATSLFTQLINELKGDTLSSVASVIGETPARTESALGSVIPALIAGLASKASTSGQATDLLDIIKSNGLDSANVADAATSLKGPGGITGLGDTGRFLMESLFGGGAASLGNWTATRSGVSRSAASSLLNLALPIVLGMIAKRVKTAGWSASNLMSLLTEERASLPDMPGLAAALNPEGARVHTAEKESAAYVAPPAPATPGPGARRGGAWLWALPLLLLIPLFSWLTRSDRPEQRVAETRTVPQVTVPRAPIPPIPEPEKPVGTSGIVSTTPREFGPYQFEFREGSSGVPLASKLELRDIAALLKANGGARADINGYADDAGDAAANLKLSEARATAMMNELVNLGVDRSRLKAQGHGEQGSVAGNATAEGRQRNRGVEIRVTNDK